MKPASSMVVLAALLVAAACTGPFPRQAAVNRLSVSVTTPNIGTRDVPLPLALDVSQASPVSLHVTSLLPDGTTDTSFNGYVRLSVKPGTVATVTGTGANGRNVLLTAGVSPDVSVTFVGSYGPSHLWAEDIGYVPAEPTRMPPPQCSDGIDNDNDGFIDFPADTGCEFANDDTETGGTFEAGASDTMFFALPRVADVRGVSTGGTATAYPHEQVEIDTGYRSTPTPHFLFNTVVTRLSSDGFYFTDINDTRGFSSVFAYNFSTPPSMRVCDRLLSVGGTSADFFGFTEIGFPTWELEEWDPTTRECMVPAPYVFQPGDLPVPPMTTSLLLNKTAALVRLYSQGAITVHVSAHFGAANPPPPDYAPTADASNCDYNNDGKVDFTTGPEMTCSNACDADPDCTEYSNFKSQSAFRMVVSDGTTTGAILANASADAEFDPLLFKGKAIRAFTGTLRYFSGGSQFTVEARCSDDIVTDLTQLPVPSDDDYNAAQNPLPPAMRVYACAHSRTIFDTSTSAN